MDSMCWSVLVGLVSVTLVSMTHFFLLLTAVFNFLCFTVQFFRSYQISRSSMSCGNSRTPNALLSLSQQRQIQKGLAMAHLLAPYSRSRFQKWDRPVLPA